MLSDDGIWMGKWFGLETALCVAAGRVATRLAEESDGRLGMEH